MLTERAAGLLAVEPHAGVSEGEAVARVPEVRRRLGTGVLILGHHYQRDEVIQFADLTGDSYGLARQASRRHESKYIVFCGVHFMAESADILAAPHQRVVLPDLTAGCSMADMAEVEQVEMAWEEMADALDDDPANDRSRRPPTGAEAGAEAEVMPI